MAWIEWFDRHPSCDEYVGLTLAEVKQLVDSQHLRVMNVNEVEAAADAGTTVAFTADLRPNRVNVLVQDGVVTAAGKF